MGRSSHPPRAGARVGSALEREPSARREPGADAERCRLFGSCPAGSEHRADAPFAADDVLPWRGVATTSPSDTSGPRGLSGHLSKRLKAPSTGWRLSARLERHRPGRARGTGLASAAPMSTRGKSTPSAYTGLDHIFVAGQWRRGKSRSQPNRDVNPYNRETLLEILPVDLPGKESRVYKRPVGVVGVISPWNWPLHLTARSLFPALAVGNAVVIKPASDTPVTGGLLLAKILEEAGLPGGTVSVIIGKGSEVGDAFVTHAAPRVISFDAGRAGYPAVGVGGRHHQARSAPSAARRTRGSGASMVAGRSRRSRRTTG
jgi:hypothetical protein